MSKIPVVGFISAPAWFDPAIIEFPTIVEDRVHVQQAPLRLPEFDYSLKSIALVQDELIACAQCLESMDCSLAAQVGSPFSWAGISSEPEARKRCETIAGSANIPCIMTGLAIIDGLRALGVKKLALNCTYYESDWRDSFANFINLCGFEIVTISTLADQGLATAGVALFDHGWAMADQLTSQSILAIAAASPDAEAIVVTGAGARTLNILAALEARINRPIVAADTALYWAIAKALNLTLKPEMGHFSSL